jgi:cell wall-associated NlpC family hydrolase
MTLREFEIALNAEARKWVGTPYKHMGKTRNGCDCLGLVMGVMSNIGIVPPKSMYVKYSLNWNLGNPLSYENSISAHCVPTKTRRIGDICAFKIRNTGINHIGLWVTSDKFITSADDRFWGKHYVGDWRIIMLSKYVGGK